MASHNNICEGESCVGSPAFCRIQFPSSLIHLLYLSSPAVQGTYVDFFNPKMRRELEKKDEDIKRTTGLKGAAPGGDDWSYLTSYSRVPVGDTCVT